MGSSIWCTSILEVLYDVLSKHGVVFHLGITTDGVKLENAQPHQYDAAFREACAKISDPNVPSLDIFIKLRPKGVKSKSNKIPETSATPRSGFVVASTAVAHHSSLLGTPPNAASSTSELPA